MKTTHLEEFWKHLWIRKKQNHAFNIGRQKEFSAVQTDLQKELLKN